MNYVYFRVGNTDGEGEKGQGSSKNRDEIWESATWYILINILLFADFPPFIFCASMWRLERGENITSHLVLYSVLYPIPVKPICRKKCKLDGSISSTRRYEIHHEIQDDLGCCKIHTTLNTNSSRPSQAKNVWPCKNEEVSRPKAVFWSISNCISIQGIAFTKWRGRRTQIWLVSLQYIFPLKTSIRSVGYSKQS